MSNISKSCLRSKLKIENSLPVQAGFSLVEMILLISVAGLVILVIANIPYAINLIGVGNHESTARQIVAQKITDIRSTGYDNLANGTTSIVDPRLNSLSSSMGTVLIEDCPLETCPNGELAKKIVITIDWKERDKPNQFKIVTIVSKGGIK